MIWSDDDTVLTIEDTAFRTMGSPAGQSESLIAIMGLGAVTSSGDSLVLLKTRPMIERYVDLVRTTAPSTVVDLGIFEGGSVALVAKIAKPSTVVAIDSRPERVPGLDDFTILNGLTDVIHAHYGIDQADTPALSVILNEHIDGLIDLVLDDCSHRYEPTVAAFDLIYPRLRAGGIYVIEDWSWGVVPLATPELTDRLRDLPSRPLAAFLIDLALVAATRPDVVARVTIDDSMVTIERGPAELDATFRLCDLRWEELEVDLQLPGR